MQIIQKILLITIATIVICGYFLKFSKKSNIDSNTQKTLIIGTAGGYAPFVSMNAQGEYEGFDIDFANALAKDLNYNLEIKDLGSMTSLFIALEQGKIDAIIWALSITAERLDKVAMIRYQGENTTSFPLIFWEKTPNNATSINELQGATICVEPTSCQEAVLNKYDFITKLPTSHVDDALLSIMYNKADGALIEPAIAKKFHDKYPQIKILDLPLSPEDQIQGIGIAVKKNNIELIKQLRKAINNLEEKNIISDLEIKWNIAS